VPGYRIRSIKPTNRMKLGMAMLKLTFMTENFCIATHVKSHSQKPLTSHTWDKAIPSVKRGSFDQAYDPLLKQQNHKEPFLFRDSLIFFIPVQHRAWLGQLI